jgi:hypothetical protein
VVQVGQVDDLSNFCGGARAGGISGVSVWRC